MPLIITDDLLKAAGLSELEAKVEIACRLFDAGKLSIGHAAAWTGLSVPDFELQLATRSLPRFRYTDDMLQNDIDTLKSLRRW
ncbi:MAG TPA: UPF0175 family protein [Phycisphaerae bacterium]|nr:UPF0175 family protein [Phycisphaerae bacterium]